MIERKGENHIQQTSKPYYLVEDGYLPEAHRENKQQLLEQLRTRHEARKGLGRRLIDIFRK